MLLKFLIRRTFAGLGFSYKLNSLYDKIKIFYNNMGGYNFINAKKEWTHIPVEGGERVYISSKELLGKTDEELIHLAALTEKTRYDINGWRNYNNLWRRYSGVDDLSGKKMLDFGCGFGIEALQFAKRGNSIRLADINQSNIDLAEKLLQAHGFRLDGKYLILKDYPFLNIEEKIDLFYSIGVLHHTPKFREILKRAAEILSEDGQIRLLLYSDMAWRMVTGSELPDIKMDIRKNKFFYEFVRHMDTVGSYADWYNKEKIEYLVGDFLKVETFNYITEDNRYLMVTLKNR